MAKLKFDAPPPAVLLEGDRRVQALQLAHREPRTSDDYVEAISGLWSKAQQAFLDIGRLLLKAKDALPHGEYTSAVEARLPFSGRTAYQIREATRWVIEMERRQEALAERLPSSYSTIYLLSTLDPATLQAAEKAGVVRPDLRRAELIAWRRERGGERNEDRAALQAKRERLRRERERLDEELRRVEAQLGDVG